MILRNIQIIKCAFILLSLLKKMQIEGHTYASKVLIYISFEYQNQLKVFLQFSHKSIYIFLHIPNMTSLRNGIILQDIGNFRTSFIHKALEILSNMLTFDNINYENGTELRRPTLSKFYARTCKSCVSFWVIKIQCKSVQCKLFQVIERKLSLLSRAPSREQLTGYQQGDKNSHKMRQDEVLIKLV